MKAGLPAEPANASCARCGAAFRCGANDPAPCPCGGLALAPELLLRLRQRYAGCLCLGCLRALAQDAAPSDAAASDGGR